MAPRPPERHKLSRAQKKKLLRSTPSPKALLTSAISCLQTGNPTEALSNATRALNMINERPSNGPSDKLAALNLLGEINVELGEIDAARKWFRKAVDLDPDGDAAEEQDGGAEKFLWLAQLSEDGGEDSVRWFQKGAEVLRRQLLDDELEEEAREEKRQKLASALCGIAEVYMTDLSWDDKEAESQCDAVMAEALKVAPENVEVLQTLASVRISQLRKDEAREHLKTSLLLWRDREPEDPNVPAFPIRISLTRLLMEAEMEEEAMEVLERLVSEDDQSVEAWYLGGWCQYVQAEKEKAKMDVGGADLTAEIATVLVRSRKWLLQCLKLYRIQGYEDERLHEHATELVASLNAVLGEPAEEDGALEDEEEREDAEDSEDEAMDAI